MTMPRARRNPWLNVKLLVAGSVLIATVAFLVYHALGSSMAYFVTVGELQTSTTDMTGRQLRVGGNVENGSIQQAGVGQEMHFVVTDGTHTLPVTYSGTVPDIFADGVEVVVEGTMQPDGSIVANNVLTKCPSKFQSADSSGS